VTLDQVFFRQSSSLETVVLGTVWYWHPRNVDSNGTRGRDAVRGPADGSHGELLPKLRSKDRDSRSRSLCGRKYCFGICNLKFEFCRATCVTSVGRKVLLEARLQFQFLIS